MYEMNRRTFLAATGASALFNTQIAPNPIQQSGTQADCRCHIPNMTCQNVRVWEEDGTVYASGANGKTKGTNAAKIIQSALDSLPDSRPSKRTVAVDGSMEVPTRIQLPDQVILDLTGATLTAKGNKHILTAEGTSDSLVRGGVLDGEGQSAGEKYLGVIGTNKAERVTIFGTHVKNGGYYGINLFDANDCLLWGVSSNDNYRHGIHPGSSTEKWGHGNRVVHCTTVNNGVDGINDRGSEQSSKALHNQYINCLARGNGKNGFHLSDGGPSDTDKIATYHLIGCQSIDNKQRGFRIGGAEASLINPVASENDVGILIDGSNRVSAVDPYITNQDRADADGIVITGFGSNLDHHVLVSGGVIHTTGRNVLINADDGDGSITLRDVDINDEDGSTIKHSGYVSDLTIRNVIGYPTTNSSREYTSADGETTQFNWSHGLAETPASISVAAGSKDALGPYVVDAGDSDIRVIYQEPPPAGTDNLKWWWEADVYP